MFLQETFKFIVYHWSEFGINPLVVVVQPILFLPGSASSYRWLWCRFGQSVKVSKRRKSPYSVVSPFTQTIIFSVRSPYSPNRYKAGSFDMTIPASITRSLNSWRDAHRSFVHVQEITNAVAPVPCP